MLRLQAPLPDRYTTADPDALRDMIRAAKAELGPKLLILGHHYQRDEVMEWADARGDSFKLARFAADSEATDIVFCGVHFMAESADVLTGDHQRVVLPDQHLGRNTGFDMGYGEDDMRVWNPSKELGGLEERDVKDATFLLWRGWCSVHQRFTPEHVAAFRAEHPDGTVIVHPECSHEVVEVADQVGSTERILDWVEAAPAGSVIGVGTEIHMVQRLAHDNPDKTVVSLDPLVCPCSTMFRIDAPHLAWCLESLVRGEVVNRIVVDDDTAEQARVALQRMLDIT